MWKKEVRKKLALVEKTLEIKIDLFEAVDSIISRASYNTLVERIRNNRFPYNIESHSYLARDICQSTKDNREHILGILGQMEPVAMGDALFSFPPTFEEQRKTCIDC